MSRSHTSGLAPFPHHPRVALLSTYFENTGDDLIRAGVIRQIDAILGSGARFRHITKSNRLSRYLPFSRAAHFPVQRMAPARRRRAEFLGRLLRRLPGTQWVETSRRCDLFVVAGTPIFYFVGDRDFVANERIYSADWPAEIFEKVLDKPSAPPLIGLGLGSIYEGAPGELLARHPDAASFIARFLRRARLVTTRDAGTTALLESACPERRHILHRSYCPSLWAPAALGIEPGGRPGNRALVGFSLESASWNPVPGVAEARRQAFEWLIEILREKDCPVQLVAHNDLDDRLQRELAERFGLPPPIRPGAGELLREANRSRLIVTWRVHGSLAALSMGTPVALFRTDSRYQAAAEFGAEVLDDLDLDRARLKAVVDRLYGEDEGQRRARVGRVRERIIEETERLRARFRESFPL